MSKSNSLQTMYDNHYDNLKASVRQVDNFKKIESQVKEQVVYKLMHKPTGLFFHPQGYQGNVSEVGKVYSNKKPPRQSFIHIPHGVKPKTDYDVSILTKYKHYDAYRTELDDWVVVEYNLVEIK